MKVYQEMIQSRFGESFLVRRFEEKNFSCPLHNHSEIELTYIVQSNGTRIIGDDIASFSPGDLCLIGEGLPHIYRNSKGSRGMAISEVLHFERGFAEGLLDKTPELEAFSNILNRARQGLVFSNQTSKEIGLLMPELRVVTGSRRWLLFFQIVDILCHDPNPQTLSSSGFAGSSNEDDPRIHEVCNYILEHYQDPLPHEMMAKRIHVTTAHFSRIFKRSTRKTYQEFLTEVRLGHACRQLVETDLPVTEIAFGSGFNNLSNFNRQFRKKYQVSPRDYRRQLNNA